MRRAVDTRARRRRASRSAVNIVGFSGATFTNAPNAGAVFLVLDPFEKRAKDPKQSAAAIQGALFGKLARHPGGLGVRGAAAAGAGHRQRRRLPHDGRGSRRARAAGAAGRGLRHDGPGRADAGPAAGVLAVRDLDAAALSRHRPHQGAAARHQRRRRVHARCRSISARPTSTTSTCSAAPSACTAQAERRFRLDTEGRAAICACAIPAARRCRSARSRPCATSPGPYRVPRYNLYPAAELDGAAAPGYSPGPGDRDHAEARRRDAAGRLRLRVDDARLPAIARRQHRDLRLRAWRGVRVPGAGGAVSRA